MPRVLEANTLRFFDTCQIAKMDFNNKYLNILQPLYAVYNQEIRGQEQSEGQSLLIRLGL
jgi:hypothetical protein